MATTTPDNLRTPNPGDSYNLVPDLQTLAQDVQDALIARGNVFRGTVAQRTAYLSTALPGMLWQDTDGIGMLWKRGASQWEPAVWRWSGTTTQMNAFTQAPNGFEWFNTTTSSLHVRLSGVWAPGPGSASLASLASGTINSGGWTIFSSPGNWNVSSTLMASNPWTTGLVAPVAGKYRVTGSVRIAFNNPIHLVAKLNNTAVSSAGLIVGTTSQGFSAECLASFTRDISLSANDVVTFAAFTSATGGPFGMTPSGTSFSLELLSY